VRATDCDHPVTTTSSDPGARRRPWSTRLPIRVRITLAATLSLALILAALSAFVYSRVEAQLLEAVDLGLQARAGAIASGIGEQGVAIGDAPDTGPASVAQILTRSGHVQETSGPSSSLVPASLLQSIHSPTYLTVPPRPGSGVTRVFVLPVDEGTPLYVVTGSSMAGPSQTLDRLRLLLLVGGPAALALASFVAWLLAGVALRPVDRMRQEAAAISVSEPGRRLPVPDTDDEVSRLGRTLNSLLERLEKARGRERRLLDDASHELRTPLGILKAEIDIALSRSRSNDELVAALQSASEETDRLSRLAEDLLVLSRARSGQLDVHRTDVSLRELLERASEAHRGRFEAAGLSIECRAADVTVRVDPMRIRQALDNLLDNARRYAPAKGVVRVHGEFAAGVVTIAVIDQGTGFAEDVLPNAFEPFVRSAPPGQAGAGLGLSIVRAVAEAHGGTALAENVPGGGAKLTMTLPHASPRHPAPAASSETGPGP
jgi:two-component system, OmpR family, sensor kinase